MVDVFLAAVEVVVRDFLLKEVLFVVAVVAYCNSNGCWCLQYSSCSIMRAEVVVFVVVVVV